MGLKSKALRTVDDLTLKQRKFIDILVAHWGEITKGEALKRAGYNAKNTAIVAPSRFCPPAE